MTIARRITIDRREEEVRGARVKVNSVVNRWRADGNLTKPKLRVIICERNSTCLPLIVCSIMNVALRVGMRGASVAFESSEATSILPVLRNISSSDMGCTADEEGLTLEGQPNAFATLLS